MVRSRGTLPPKPCPDGARAPWDEDVCVCVGGGGGGKCDVWIQHTCRSQPSIAHAQKRVERARMRARGADMSHDMDAARQCRALAAWTYRPHSRYGINALLPTIPPKRRGEAPQKVSSTRCRWIKLIAATVRHAPRTRSLDKAVFPAASKSVPTVDTATATTSARVGFGVGGRRSPFANRCFGSKRSVSSLDLNHRVWVDWHWRCERVHRGSCCCG
jgi:hypothetical protein